MLEMWSKIFDKYLPGNNWTFSTEVEGEYYTNDKDICGKYITIVDDCHVRLTPLSIYQ